MNVKSRSWPYKTEVFTLLSGAALLSSWVVLWSMVLLTMWGLSPYEAVPPDQRPAVGTWERTINDTFESTLQVVPPWLMVGASAFLLVRALRRGQNPVTTMTRFAGLNFGFALATIVPILLIGVVNMSDYRARIPTYALVFVYVGIDIVLYAMLLWRQVRLARG